MNAIDTNVWIYCHDTRDREKQEKAQELVSTVGSTVLLWQVGCEFVAAARKLEPLGFEPADAWEALGDMQAMAERIAVPGPELWWRCRELQQNHSLHFWDALLIACCLFWERVGVRVGPNRHFIIFSDRTIEAKFAKCKSGPGLPGLQALDIAPASK